MATKTTTAADAVVEAAPIRVPRRADIPADASADRVDRRVNRTPSSEAIVSEANSGTDSRDGGEIEGGKRRMPENLQRYLIRMQGGKMYLPAAYRIVWFRDELGDDWGIQTALVEGGHEAGFATVRATIVNEQNRIIASGHKTESKSDFPAGWVEKAESGAVARALALLGFGTQFSPELDDDGYRPADSPQPRRAYAQKRNGPDNSVSSINSANTVNSVSSSALREDATERGRPQAGGSASGDGSAQGAASNASPATVVTALQEVWAGPGQCPQCHAPEGKRHGRQCLG